MIQSTFRWIALFVLCFVLQTTLASAISIFGVKPDLIVVALFMLAIKTGPMPALYVGFFVGLAEDLYVPGVLGQNALAKTIAGFFAGLFNERVMRLDPVFQAILLVVTFIVADSVFMAVQAAKTQGTVGTVLGQLVVATLPRAIYSMAFAAVPYMWENLFRAALKR